MKCAPLLLLLLLALPVFGNDRVVIDQSFCETRALLNQATVEALNHGEDKESVKRNFLALMRATPHGSPLRRAVPQALLDVDEYFLIKHRQNPFQTYITSVHTCRDMAGMVLR